MKTFLPLALLAASVFVAQRYARAEGAVESADEAMNAATIEKIKAAWEERQRKFNTVRATWTSHQTYMKGMLPASIPHDDEREFPAEDVTNSREYSVLLHGGKVRYSRSGPTWYADLGRFAETTYVSTFNGKMSCDLFSGEGQETLAGRPAGSIGRQATRFRDHGDYTIVAVLMNFKPLMTKIDGIDLSKWKVSSRRPRLQGTDCIVIDVPLTATLDMSVARRELWLDPSRDYVILRDEQHVVGGPLILRVTIQ